MAYSEAELDSIFMKSGWSLGWPNWGVDCDGRTISRSEYGRFSAYGWQVDHILPIALGGGDQAINLRPRHWRGNCGAGGLLGGILG